MTDRGPQWTRRKILAGLSTATLALVGCQTQSEGASPFRLGGTGTGGGTIDVGRIFGGLTSMFSGLSLGEGDEIDMGQKLYPALIARSGGPYRNRRVQTAMGEIFESRLGAARERDLPWEITVVNDSTVNAWALPGGKIAVNKGLLRYVDSEDELAAVIGHEMGHVELSHAIGEMRTERFARGFTSIGAEVMSSQLSQGGAQGMLSGQALQYLIGPMHEMVTTGYSREAEHEADGHMVKVFRTSGHDPQKGVAFFRTLLEIIPRDSELTTSLFSTHPGTRARIDAILAEAQSQPMAAPRGTSQAFAVLKESFPTRRVYKRQANQGN